MSRKQSGNGSTTTNRTVHKGASAGFFARNDSHVPNQHTAKMSARKYPAMNTSQTTPTLKPNIRPSRSEIDGPLTAWYRPVANGTKFDSTNTNSGHRSIR